MPYHYKAEDVFEMAIQIEKNGAAFYRKAADFQEDPSDKDFLETLACMEDNHRADFEKMKKQVSELEKPQTVSDPDEELALYLKAMADVHGGEGNPDIADLFSGQETMTEIINTAIDLEKESILFYIGLKEMVPLKFGREKINAIINEEIKHVAQLNGFLEKTPKAAS